VQILTQYTREYLEYLEYLHPLSAAALLALGGIFLALGWKQYKALITLDAMALGAALGVYLATQYTHRANMDLYLGTAGAVLFAAIAWPLMKWAVCVLGALVGGVVGYAAWCYAARAFANPNLGQQAWAGGVLGLVVVGLLSLVIFRTVVILIMALEGSVLLVSGAFGLLLNHQGVHEPLKARLTENIYLLPLALLLPALIGFIFQQSKFLQLQAKKRKLAMQKPGG